MGTVQSSPANEPSKEVHEVISSVQIAGERGRCNEDKRINETSDENPEKTSFIKVNQFEDSVIRNLTLDTSELETESDDSSEESEYEEYEEDTERYFIFEDIKNLRLLAKAFHHPEIAVSTIDTNVFARNYFSRPSAPTNEDGDSEERAQILAEAAALKKLAVDYAHPEVTMSTTDSSMFARNYFGRPSAPTDEDDDSEERAQILAEAAALKELAVDYAHPEVAVSTTDSSMFARNYFGRPSAPSDEDDDSEERAQILAEAAALKKLAVDYAHPEFAVSTTDANIFARNYFSRLSSFEEEGDGLTEERRQVIADVNELKKLAIAYAHPEHSIIKTDATAFGRNYFTMLSMNKPLKVLDAPCPTEERKDVANTKTFDKQQPVSSKLSGVTDCALGNVKRSPSSVILFGLGDDEGSAY